MFGRLLVRGCSSSSGAGVRLSKEAVFFQPPVQALLAGLAGSHYEKVFKRRRLGVASQRPIYQFMTGEELAEAQQDMRARARAKLVSPPCMEERGSKSRRLEVDTQLQGFSVSKFVFTDISYGVSDRERVVVVREPDGSLRTAEWEEQDRVTGVYFPREGRKHYEPQMFEPAQLAGLLGPDKYEYILDRNCLQFEPDHPTYLRTLGLVHAHIVEHGHFDTLHSTRHYGPLVFSLCWNKELDSLLIHLLSKGRLPEAVLTVQLYLLLHPEGPLARRGEAELSQLEPLALLALLSELELPGERGRRLGLAIELHSRERESQRESAEGHGL